MPGRARPRQTPPAMTTILALDCALEGLSVALWQDGVVVAQRARGGRDQAATLFPELAALFAETGIAQNAVDLLAASRGPGSFTGVRAGLAAARGLAIALERPLAGITTTDALLEGAPAGAVAAIASGLGDWFCALAPGAAPFVADAAAFSNAAIVVGTGLAPLGGLRADGGPRELRAAGPLAPALAALAARRSVAEWRAENASDGLPRPLYLRGASVTTATGERRTVE